MNRTSAQYNAERATTAEDSVGDVYGCLRVVAVSHIDKSYGTFVHVVCGCGEPETRRLSTLKSAAPKLGCPRCRHLRTALRLYPLRGDSRPLHERALRARGSWRA